MAHSKDLVEINADDLITALQTSDFDSSFFLNLETGAVDIYDNGMLNGEAIKEEAADELLMSDTYVRIDGLGSSESYKIMESFVDELGSGIAKRMLSFAISGPKPFRRFKDALHELGEVREDWFRYEHLAYLDIARAWLAEHNIKATLIDPLSK